MEKPCTEPGSRASPMLHHRPRAAPAECSGQDLCPQTRLLEAARPSRFHHQPLLRGGLRGASQGPAHFSLLPPEPLLREASVVFIAGICFPTFGSQRPDLGGRMGRNHSQALVCLDRVKLTSPTCLCCGHLTLNNQNMVRPHYKGLMRGWTQRPEPLKPSRAFFFVPHRKSTLNIHWKD